MTDISLKIAYESTKNTKSLLFWHVEVDVVKLLPEVEIANLLVVLNCKSNFN